MSTSVLVLFWVLGLLIVAGLVVDGGQQVTAARRAEAVAAGAARAATDAGAPSRVAGRSDPGAALSAANRYLAASAPVTGSASLEAGAVRVSTSHRAPTIFLSLLGIREVRASASARADLLEGE